MLNEAQRMIRETARQFAAAALAPGAAERDRDHAVPREAIGQAGRLGLLGMTAIAFRLSISARIQSISNALSARRAWKSMPVSNGATPMLSWRWPGRRTKRLRLPRASTNATIFVVSRPRDLPMA